VSAVTLRGQLFFHLLIVLSERRGAVALTVLNELGVGGIALHTMV